MQTTAMGEKNEESTIKGSLLIFSIAVYIRAHLHYTQEDKWILACKQAYKQG